MFLLDDLLKLPAQGLLWVVRELYEAAQQDRHEEAAQIRGALRDLYLALEQGAITEDEFARQEARLLDRLDTLENASDGRPDGTASSDFEEAEDVDHPGDDQDADGNGQGEDRGDEDGQDQELGDQDTMAESASPENEPRVVAARPPAAEYRREQNRMEKGRTECHAGSGKAVGGYQPADGAAVRSRRSTGSAPEGTEREPWVTRDPGAFDYCSPNLGRGPVSDAAPSDLAARDACKGKAAGEDVWRDYCRIRPGGQDPSERAFGSAATRPAAGTTMLLKQKQARS